MSLLKYLRLINRKDTMKYIVRKSFGSCCLEKLILPDGLTKVEGYDIETLLKLGYLRELPEKKSLWDKLLSDYYIDGRSSAYWLKEIAPKISEQHFREEGWVKKEDVVKEIERWKCNVRMTSNDLIQKIKEM